MLISEGSALSCVWFLGSFHYSPSHRRVTSNILSHGGAIYVKKKMGHPCDMARDDPQFRIRLPAEVKAHVEREAKRSRRSLNAEIVYLLQLALDRLSEWERHHAFAAEYQAQADEHFEHQAREERRITDLESSVNNDDLMAIIKRRLEGPKRV